METELRPGQHLEQFLEGPEAARQGDEAIRQFGHAGLAGMHRIDHLEPRQPAMADLPVHERLRDDPVTWPPAAMQASATAPIRPTLPPP